MTPRPGQRVTIDLPFGLGVTGTVLEVLASPRRDGRPVPSVRVAPDGGGEPWEAPCAACTVLR